MMLYLSRMYATCRSDGAEKENIMENVTISNAVESMEYSHNAALRKLRQSLRLPERKDGQICTPQHREELPEFVEMLSIFDDLFQNGNLDVQELRRQLRREQFPIALQNEFIQLLPTLHKLIEAELEQSIGSVLLENAKRLVLAQTAGLFSYRGLEDKVLTAKADFARKRNASLLTRQTARNRFAEVTGVQKKANLATQARMYWEQLDDSQKAEYKKLTVELEKSVGNICNWFLRACTKTEFADMQTIGRLWAEQFTSDPSILWLWPSDIGHKYKPWFWFLEDVKPDYVCEESGGLGFRQTGLLNALPVSKAWIAKASMQEYCNTADVPLYLVQMDLVYQIQRKMSVCADTIRKAYKDYRSGYVGLSLPETGYTKEQLYTTIESNSVMVPAVMDSSLNMRNLADTCKRYCAYKGVLQALREWIGEDNP